MKVLDPLYGDISFSSAISNLAKVPIVQRLRHVRLSNIDSLDMPGISGISRYEHSLGVAHLAQRVSRNNHLNERTSLILQSAALLHDSLISPFGHLVEEAMGYAGIEFSHENMLNKLFIGDEEDEIGGLERQVLYGRSTRLTEWASSAFKCDYREAMCEISLSIKGDGKVGALVAGGIDLDNIDNICRVAFHMGLDVDKELPLQLADSFSIKNDGIRFYDSSVKYIEKWLCLRAEVYSRFMPARQDFTCKVMLLYATVHALHCGVLSRTDWSLSDVEYMGKLLHSKEKNIVEIVQRWLSGELWTLSDLIWFDDNAPSHKDILTFSELLTKELSRECFVYRIKDKRYRKVSFSTVDNKDICLGENSNKWLMGVASPSKKAFTHKNMDAIVSLAMRYFGVEPLASGNDFKYDTSSLF